MVDIEFSQYQKDIFEFIKHGFGNAVVLAVAGSGKSFTVINGLSYIKPDKRVLFSAFNSSIVEELKKKIHRENTDIKTIHSIGLSMIRYAFKGKEIIIDENKYPSKLTEILVGNSLAYNKNYIKTIIKLCNLGRFYLVKDIKELTKIANKYSIVAHYDEIEISLELINWGENSLNEINTIDYTDMIFLPNALNLRGFKYDFIVIDEAQDLSVSQISLIMKCFKQGTRFIAVGDEKQAIYGFSGSDIDSFRKLRTSNNTIELPLSVCYRCPKKVIKLAQKLVPYIMYSDNAIEGNIIYEATIDNLVSGDMVICRNTVPLIKLYTQLISNSIACYIKGVDIGVNLIDIIENLRSNNIIELIKELDETIYKYIIINEKNLVLSKEEINKTQEYNDLNDKIECIKLLSIGLDTKEELINKITNIFSDENNKGICLSTIHKAKGLEADNVYLLDRHLLPSKYAKQEWELIQEQNLEYVAYTRAKKTLGFLKSE